MRELICKNMTDPDYKRRDFRLEEDAVRDGVHLHTERRCLYLIKDMVHMGEDSKADSLAKFKRQDVKRRNFHIWKKNRGDNNETLICKVFGEVYAVVGNAVYLIGYMHSLKIDFYPVVEANKK